MHAKYAERGLSILAFPCNQFANQAFLIKPFSHPDKVVVTAVLFINQEPGTHKQIKQYVESYNVQFDLFGKINVNGPESHPLWKWMKEEPKGVGFLGNSIKWNFTKFLINRQGQVVKRYSPLKDPIVIERHPLLKYL